MRFLVFSLLILGGAFPISALAIPAPTEVAATTATNLAFVKITWTGIDSVTNYEVWRSIDTNLSGADLIGTNVAGATVFLDLQADYRTEYHYWVRGSDASGFGDFSDSATGSQSWRKWTFSIDGTPNGPAAMEPGGKMYITSVGRFSSPPSNGKLYAFNSNGTVSWVFEADSHIDTWASVSPQDGTIYFGCANGKLYAVNPDGTLKWTSQCKEAILGTTPTIGSDGTIYVATHSYLNAISSTGTPVWTNTFSGANLTSPAIGQDGTIYMEHSLAALLAFAKDGSTEWGYSPSHTGTGAQTSPAIDRDGTIYFGLSGTLYALGPDEILKWSYTTTPLQLIARSPVITQESNIVFVTSTRLLKEVGQGGKLLWQYTGPQANDAPSNPTLLSDGSILLLYPSVAAKLVVLNSDGTLRSTFETGEWTYSDPPLVSTDGSIYLGANDGTFSAYAGSAGPAASAWPMFAHDNGRTANAATGITAAPIIHLSGALNSRGAFVLSISGLVPGEWAVDLSPDLTQWHSLTILTNPPASYDLPEAAPNDGTRFYRVHSK